MKNSTFFIGNTEVVQCEDWPNYAVSKCGNIFRISSGKLMEPQLRGKPLYRSVRVCHNNIPKHAKISRAVAKAWVHNPLPDRYGIVNHIDGDTLNDYYTNLEWTDIDGNKRHSVDTGLEGRGEDLYNSTLTNEMAHDVCRLLLQGFLIKDIADMFCVSRDVIGKIKSGDSYHHVRMLYDIPHKYRNQLSVSTIHWVCNHISDGRSDAYIVKNSSNVNVTRDEVKRIRYGIRYKVISSMYF